MNDPSRCGTSKTMASLLVMIAVLLNGCSPSPVEPTLTDLPKSVKGYELYSWQDGAEWRFALLQGTNRTKTYEEVSSAEMQVSGLGPLLDMLRRVPEGEYLLWSTALVPGTALPEGEIVEQVKTFCAERSISLSVWGG